MKRATTVKAMMTVAMTAVLSLTPAMAQTGSGGSGDGDPRTGGTYNDDNRGFDWGLLGLLGLAGLAGMRRRDDTRGGTTR